MTTHGDRGWVIWVEPTPDGHRVRLSRWLSGTWGAAITIDEGPAVVADWTIPPRLVSAAQGERLLAAFERMEPDGTTRLYVARSSDGGRSWSRAQPASSGPTTGQHAALQVIGEEARLVWLGEGSSGAGSHLAHASMPLTGAVRQAHATSPPDADLRADLDASGASSEPAATQPHRCGAPVATAVDGDLVVAFRAGGPDHHQDVRVGRSTGDEWRIATVHEDGWQAPGCRASGHAIASTGDAVAVAWYTGSPHPEIRLAWSFDSGVSFDPPYVVDQGPGRLTPTDRLDLAPLPDGSVAVVWLATDGEQALLRARRVTADGREGDATVLATMPARDVQGVPRAARVDGGLLTVWSERDAPRGLQSSWWPLARLGAARDQARLVTMTGLAEPLPDRLPDLAATSLDGDPWVLSDLEGAPVLVTLVEGWCGTCAAQLDALDETRRRLIDADGHAVVVALDDDPGAAARLAAARPHWTWTRTDGAAARRALGSARVPGSYLFDGTGRLLWSSRQRIHEGDPSLRAAVDAAIRRGSAPDTGSGPAAGR